jgi:1-acyl-sn-glycerol-3-phosphate acyltransferase
MINTLRFTVGALRATMIWGPRAIGAARRELPDTPGGPYDEASLGWSRMLLEAARITVKVEHAERLTTRNVVYIANHISMIDIPVLVTAVPVVPKFVMKQELLRVPVFGAAAKAAGHIAIDRKNRGAAFAAYDDAAKTIRRGHPALVFAEGTRSRNGRLMAFKKGPFVLAIAAQVPVVPLAVVGSYELMPRLSMSPRPGEVIVRVGEDIPTAGLRYQDRDQLSRQTRAALVALGANE